MSPDASSKEDVLAAFATLPGVSEVRAELLWDAGFTSVEALRSAAVEDLTAVEGIGAKTAEGILEAVGDLEAAAPEPAPEPAGEVEPEAEAVEAAEEDLGVPEPSDEAEEEALEEDLDEEPDEEAPGEDLDEEPDEEPEDVYVVKPDPELDPETARALAEREKAKGRRPTFRRQTAWQFKKLEDTWRVPRGLHSKQRHGLRYRSRRPRVGHRGPAKARGLHPSGFEEVLVHRPDDLDGIDPATQAARIGGTVGAKKREAILERAEELDIHVLNPGRM